MVKEVGGEGSGEGVLLVGVDDAFEVDGAAVDLLLEDGEDSGGGVSGWRWAWVHGGWVTLADWPGR